MVFSMLEVLMFLVYTGEFTEYKQISDREDVLEDEEQKRNNLEQENQLKLESMLNDAEREKILAQKKEEFKKAEEEEKKSWESLISQKEESSSKIKKFEDWFKHLRRVSDEIIKSDIPKLAEKFDGFAVRPIGSDRLTHIGWLYIKDMAKFYHADYLFPNDRTRRFPILEIMKEIFETGSWHFQEGVDYGTYFAGIKLVGKEYTSGFKKYAEDQILPEEYGGADIIILAPERNSMCLRYLICDLKNYAALAPDIDNDLLPLSVWNDVLQVLIKYAENTNDSDLRRMELLILFNAMAKKNIDKTLELAKKYKKYIDLEASPKETGSTIFDATGNKGLVELKKRLLPTPSSPTN